MRSKLSLIIGVVLIATFGACGGDDNGRDEPTATTAASGAATTAVAVKDFAFNPKSIRVKVGDTVTWTNEDQFDHSVDIDALGLDGPNFGPETMPVSFSHQFTEAGTFDYVCGVHNSMTGTVVVSS